MNKTKIITIILFTSIILNIITGILCFHFFNKYKDEECFYEITDIVSSSDNTLQILSFYKEQLELELITKNDYSNELKELSEIHNALISLTEEKQYKNKEDLKKDVLMFLNERKKIFDNLKSAIDLDSDNYYNVATEAEQKANEYLQQINIEIAKK